MKSKTKIIYREKKESKDKINTEIERLEKIKTENYTKSFDNKKGFLGRVGGYLSAANTQRQINQLKAIKSQEVKVKQLDNAIAIAERRKKLRAIQADTTPYKFISEKDIFG